MRGCPFTECWRTERLDQRRAKKTSCGGWVTGSSGRPLGGFPVLFVGLPLRVWRQPRWSDPVPRRAGAEFALLWRPSWFCELPPAHRASPAVGANLCVVIVVENDENATVRGRVCGCEQDVHTPDECSETFQWPSPGSWPAGSWLAEISAFQYHVSRGVGGLSDTDAHDDVPSTKAMTQWGGELRTSLCTTPPPYCAHRGHCLWQNHGGPAPRQARGPCPRL